MHFSLQKAIFIMEVAIGPVTGPIATSFYYTIIVLKLANVTSVH